MCKRKITTKKPILHTYFFIKKEDGGGGTAGNLFDWKEVRQWLEDNPKRQAGILNASAAKDSSTVSGSSVKSNFTPENVSQGKLLDLERRLNQAEQVAHSQWARAQKD
ncbi:MAG: hypothetical protein HRT88_09080 [Lentisphaeraceae bacterium]|nr:hypothetical protein [Lentisphaeraceae bacterium]